MARFDGRVVLVSGAGRGIGAALAAGFARAGARVAVSDVDGTLAASSAARITADGGHAAAYALDVRDGAACRQVLDAVKRDFGAVSVLVNNAGVLIRGQFGTEGGAAVLASTLAVNVQGLANLTEAALPHLRATAGNAAHRGAILNIASIQSFASLRNSVA
jgi:NAD(P)-dependent dehydrogenase (short-subunit alcohol dehydrogenase family)